MIKERMLLRPKEVMRVLGISRKTLFRWTKKGILHFVRLPTGDKRYYRQEVIDILQHRNEFHKRDDSLSPRRPP